MSRRDSFDGAAFNLTPRINNKPNAQGTLFQVNPDQRTPESRQPRGYSPERYQAVTEALDTQRVSGDERRRRSRIFADREHANAGSGFMVYGGHAETLARAVAAVARSTVPLSDITPPHPGEPVSNDNPSLHVGVWDNGKSNEHELGHYSKPGSTAVRNQGRIALSSGRAHANEDTTVLHEIGHHVDRGQPYGTPREQGKAEGFADAYAQEHARTPGYKKKPVTIENRPQDWHSQPGLQGRQDEFDYGYRASRPEPPFNFMEDTRREMGAKTYPQGHIVGQQAILQKSAVREGGIMSRVKGVKWEYADWTGMRGTE